MTYSTAASFYPDPTWGQWINSMASREAVGVLATSNSLLQGNTSRAWTTANTAILVPFCVDRPVTAVKLACFNGSGGGDNTDLGIYNESGTLLVSSGGGSLGTNQVTVDITDTVLGVGRYYMAMAKSGTTANNSGGSVPAAPIAAGGGVCEIASCYPLATGTPVVSTQALIPAVAVLFRTVAP